MPILKPIEPKREPDELGGTMVGWLADKAEQCGYTINRERIAQWARQRTLQNYQNGTPVPEESLTAAQQAQARAKEAASQAATNAVRDRAIERGYLPAPDETTT